MAEFSTLNGYACRDDVARENIADLQTATATLRSEVDTLNDGGLNLKDNVIRDQIDTWLDEHPEATTTVQDGSITEPKLSRPLFSEVDTLKEDLNEVDFRLSESITEIEHDHYRVKSEEYMPWLPYGTLKNGYMDNDGNAHENAAWNHYEFDVSSGQQYKVHTYYISVAKAVILKNNSGSVVSVLPNGDGGIEDVDVTIPNGVVKMIINYENDVLTPTVEKLVVIKEAKINDLETLNYSLNVMKSELYVISDGQYENWLDNGTLKAGYVDLSGNEQSGATAWNHYEFNVTSGEQYNVHTYYVPVAMGVIIFNENNSIIAMYPIDGQGGIADIEFTVPTNATKMVVNYENDILVPTVKRKIGTLVPKFDNWNILSNKTFGVLGDSITYGQGVIDDRSKVWGNLIAERNGMVYSNYGISGSTMGNSADGSDTNPCWATERYKQLQGKDYAIIWFGWNDYYFGKLGTVSLSDPTTYLGAYYNTLVWLIENSPETKLGVIIPYLWTYNTDPQGFSIMSMINGLKEVCEICGIPYLDLNRYNFLQSWGSDYSNDANYYVKWDIKQKLFTSDTLHPNEKGNEYLSTIIEGFLRTL